MDLHAETFITERIPHRPPFLWLDRVLEVSDESITAEKKIPRDLDLFQGHYPDYPLMPGVLLCEAVFQAGALLIGEMHREEQGRICRRNCGQRYACLDQNPGSQVQERGSSRRYCNCQCNIKGESRSGMVYERLRSGARQGGCSGGIRLCVKKWRVTVFYTFSLDVLVR